MVLAHGDTDYTTDAREHPGLSITQGSSDGATMTPRTPRQPARTRRELTSTFEIERPKRRVLRPEDVKKSDGHHILQVMIAIALQ
jgi:hypothetical protein